MSDKDITRLYSKKIEDLHIKEGYNARIDTPLAQERLLELAQSIAIKGVREPLVVFDEGDQTFIEQGHRRIAAVMIANQDLGADIKTVYVRYGSKLDNDLDRTENLLISNGGEPLTLLEQANVVKRLLEAGRTPEQMAERGGFSLSHAKNLVLLSGASEGIRALILTNKVSASQAIEALRKFGEKTEEVLVQALTQVEGQGKKRVTQKAMGSKTKKTDWKFWGPKLYDLAYQLVFSIGNPEVDQANREEGKVLFAEIGEIIK